MKHKLLWQTLAAMREGRESDECGRKGLVAFVRS